MLNKITVCEKTYVKLPYVQWRCGTHAFYEVDTIVLRCFDCSFGCYGKTFFLVILLTIGSYGNFVWEKCQKIDKEHFDIKKYFFDFFGDTVLLLRTAE